MDPDDRRRMRRLELLVFGLYVVRGLEIGFIKVAEAFAAM